MERKFDIAFVSAFHTPFIQDDIDVLKKHFHVRVQIGHGPGAFLRIFWLALRSDIVFCWFASVYASAAVILGRLVGVKSLIVVGGVDVAKDDELGYGIWRTPWKGRLVRYALRHADRVLVVDPFLKTEAIRLAGYDGKNIVYIPTGYDCEFWKPAGVKVPLVLCVAVVDDNVRAKIKGLDIFIETAKHLPEMKFILVGVSSTMASSLRIPANMVVHPALDRVRLLPFYQHAKVYCQPSRREGLSNALCEAMLCGCIPVATDVGGTRTAVGNAGILVPSGEVSTMAEAIRSACVMEESAAIKARTRIVSLFPHENRKRDLLRIIEECMR